MASQFEKNYNKKGTHAVGNWTAFAMPTLATGAKVVDADVDNWTLVELDYVDGEQVCRQLSAKDKKMVMLVASPERFTRGYGENMANWYNEVGEVVRLVVLRPFEGHFETSAWAKNTGVTDVEVGQLAHFDHTTKKFILSDPSAPHTDYAGSTVKFIVIPNDEYDGVIDGFQTVTLMVTAS